MGFKTFEEIEAWQNARILMRMVRGFSKRAVSHRDWAWADQIVRSALSIMANIAEGHDALTNPEFASFLGYAKRSAAETRSHLYEGLDEGYVFQNEFDEASNLAKKIGAQLAKLIVHLRKNARPTQTSNELTSNKQQIPSPL